MVMNRAFRDSYFRFLVPCWQLTAAMHPMHVKCECGGDGGGVPNWDMDGDDDGNGDGDDSDWGWGL